MSSFEISVVVPVYNARPFLRRAVEAALAEPDVAEVILAEDGSTDDSLELCETLAEEFPRVRLVRHPDGGNHGAAATRNLGIRSATCEFLAFGDADNFYLPGRFDRDRELLSADGSLDGVYNAQGVHYYSEEARDTFHAAGLGAAEFLSISSPVPPDQLWRVMLGDHPEAKVIGGLGIDAITLRRNAIDKIGLFDPMLKLHQDVHFFIRMALTCRMAPGVIDRPVAVRGVHGQMRSTDEAGMSEYRRQCWTRLRAWVLTNITNAEQIAVFERAFLHRKLSWSQRWEARYHFVRYVLRNPAVMFETYGFFDLTLLKVFGRNTLTLRGISAKNRLLRSFG